MSKIISKETILQACITIQDELIEQFDKRKNELNDATFKHNQIASQSEKRAAANMELLNAITTELAFAQKEMSFLKTLDAKQQNDIVEPGALVVTNSYTFFIGVSSEKMSINEQEIMGISTLAPIYAVMKGLGKGDSFSYNNENYIIELVY